MGAGFFVIPRRCRCWISLRNSGRQSGATAFISRLFSGVPPRRAWAVIALHVAALAIMFASEDEWFERLVFVLVWVALNSFWLMLLRRATLAALMSLSSCLF